jgi:hypothetical protein
MMYSARGCVSSLTHWAKGLLFFWFLLFFCTSLQLTQTMTKHICCGITLHVHIYNTCPVAVQSQVPFLSPIPLASWNYCSLPLGKLGLCYDPVSYLGLLGHCCLVLVTTNIIFGLVPNLTQHCSHSALIPIRILLLSLWDQ